MATVLLVDDSKTLLKHVEHMLVKVGHQVVPTDCGSKAVELLASNPIDVVLTDLYMPPPDGFELVDAARALPKPPPVIVMSSNLQACDIFHGAPSLGPAATLKKPFTADQLRATIDKVLNGSSGNKDCPGRTDPAAEAAAA